MKIDVCIKSKVENQSLQKQAEKNNNLIDGDVIDCDLEPKPMACNYD